MWFGIRKCGGAIIIIKIMKEGASYQSSGSSPESKPVKRLPEGLGRIVVMKPDLRKLHRSLVEVFHEYCSEELEQS